MSSSPSARPSRRLPAVRGPAGRLCLLALVGLLAASLVACSRPDRTTSSGGPVPVDPAAGTTSGTAPATAGAAPGSAPTGSTPPGSGGSVRPAVAPRSTTIDATMKTPDGRDRTFHLYVPSGVPHRTDASPVPLLVALHGGVGWGTQYEKNSGFDGLAEANDFIVVYPDGIGAGGTDAVRTWNGGDCCGPAVKADVDDVAFISAMISGLEQQYPIDPHRVFAAGHSNGGIMAYRLACELADTIVAVGVQSSTLELAPCRPAQPVSLLHIHGTADRNLPIAGGKGDQGISGLAFNPPIDGIRTMARADGCPAQPVETTVPQNADLTIDTWSPCQAATEVQFVQVTGASHAWMGSTSGGSSKLTGETYARYDSSAAIWAFLAAHPRP